jgi:methylmalonyl-CoA decarboxylase subunit alpha
LSGSQDLRADLLERMETARRGGAHKYHERHAERGKLFVRKRLELLLDAGSFVEDGLLARTLDEGLPADAVVTGLGTIGGRPVALMANDMTVKAGAWGRTTVRKIIRIQEEAAESRVPLLYLVDSAGARLDEQFDMFMDRTHSGQIFFNQARLSGVVPQVCVMFGPSPAGSAYIPSFCDVVIMVDKNTSAFLGSPRMAEMATGEKTTEEEMGGARMHCATSGLGDVLAESEEEAIEAAKRFLEVLPSHYEEQPPAATPRDPEPNLDIESIVPQDQNKPFDITVFIKALVDEGSWLEFRELFARELVTGFARLEGRLVGIVANQSKRKGGILFSDSADKGAHFVSLCNAYGIPLLFLSDVPGYMIGAKVEQTGIIRHGAKLLHAIANSTVPRISVIVRKSYGAGYMAMSGASFHPDATIALPTAKLAIMGPEAAVNAIYFNKISEMDEEEKIRFVKEKRDEYAANLDPMRAASEFMLDAVIPASDLREELIGRFRHYSRKKHKPVARRNVVVRG